MPRGRTPKSTQPLPRRRPAKGKDAGLTIERHYTKPDVHPFDALEWVERDSVIKEKDGTVIFEMKDVEVPKDWSQLATDIAASKYFRKAGLQGDSKQGETSVRQLVGRVVDAIANEGGRADYFATKGDREAFRSELTHILVNQVGAFNSPVWFNVGLYHSYGIKGSGGNWAWDHSRGEAVETKNAYEWPQASACFLLSIEDNLVGEGGICDLIKTEARLFKGGSGTGTNFSTIRGKQERLSGGGTSSGLMSFLEVFDKAAGSLKSGGTVRRAAKMLCLDVDHPEIREFISWKSREEKKARVLIAAGYDSDFNGEAYHTVSGQNSNNSVRVTDEFMRLAYADSDVGRLWPLKARTTGEAIALVDARKDIWDLIAQAAWECADPGVQYHDTTNKWHTCKNSGPIQNSNPCGEFVYLDDTACFAPETRISTPAGLRTVKELYEHQQRGGRVHITTDLHGEHDSRRLLAYRSATITEVGEREIFQMALKDGRSIRTTADHKFLTNRGWKRLDELVVGEDRIELRESGDPVAFTSDDADVRRWQMLGWFTGDGVFSKDVAALVFGPDDAPTAAWMQDEFNKLREEAGPGMRGNCHLSTQSNGVLQISSTQTSLIGHLQEVYGFKQGTAIYKDVPSRVHHLPSDLKVAYLQGLFSSDGCIRKPRSSTEVEVMFASSSPGLMSSVQLLLSDLGIISRAIWIHPPGRANAQGQLHIYNQQARKFLALVGMPCSPPKHTKAQAALAEPFRGALKNPRPATVISIEAAGVSMVYDVTEPVTHSLVAEGMIVHNCNLSSLNLLKFLRLTPHGSPWFDIVSFKHAVRILFIAQEILVDLASYPTKKIAENSHRFRPLGLGYANLGSLLMQSGLAYDSDAGRNLAALITATMTGYAYRTSAEMAAVKGAFEGFAENRECMVDVMGMHRDALVGQRDAGDLLYAEAEKAWNEAIELGEEHGYRNGQATLLAPTGTIGLLMDCDTTGVEPTFALSAWKKLAGGGGVGIVNQSVPQALDSLGYKNSEISSLQAYAEENKTLEGSELKPEHLPIFDCALPSAPGGRCLSVDAHLDMMAAVQPFLSGAISKTVGLPANATVDDVRETYRKGWLLGLKAVALYRDGSKQSQPLNVVKKEEKKVDGETVATFTLGDQKAIVVAKRHKLPTKRPGVTQEARIGGHKVFLRTGEYPDGSVGEIFIDMHKEGASFRTLISCFARAVSLGLQYGVPLEAFVKHFTFTRFEPQGQVEGHPNIKIATSIVDWVFRFLGVEYLHRYDLAHVQPEHAEAPKESPLVATADMQSDSPPCDQCGATTVRNGACWKCVNCGSNLGCS